MAGGSGDRPLCLRGRWLERGSTAGEFNMDTKFSLHLEVALDEGLAAQAIEIARHAYKGHGASRLVDGKEQVIPPEQFISCAEQALMELVEGNPLFEKVGIRVDEVSCRRSDVPR